MEITARSSEGFFCSEFPEGQIVTIGKQPQHNIYIPVYGGLGTKFNFQDLRRQGPAPYEQALDSSQPGAHRWSALFCELLCCGGGVFLRSSGMIYAWFRDQPIFGTILLEPGAPLHANGLQLSVRWEGSPKSIAEIAQDPSLPTHCLYWLAQSFPKEVARNPILPLLLLENPSAGDQFPARLREVLNGA